MSLFSEKDWYDPFRSEKKSRMEIEYLDIERPYSSKMNVPYYQ